MLRTQQLGLLINILGLLMKRRSYFLVRLFQRFKISLPETTISLQLHCSFSKASLTRWANIVDAFYRSISTINIPLSHASLIVTTDPLHFATHVPRIDPGRTLTTDRKSHNARRCNWEDRRLLTSQRSSLRGHRKSWQANERSVVCSLRLMAATVFLGSCLNN